MNVNRALPVTTTQGPIFGDITNVVASNTKQGRDERRIRLQQKRKFPFADGATIVNPMVGQSGTPKSKHNMAGKKIQEKNTSVGMRYKFPKVSHGNSQTDENSMMFQRVNNLSGSQTLGTASSSVFNPTQQSQDGDDETRNTPQPIESDSSESGDDIWDCSSNEGDGFQSDSEDDTTRMMEI
ncbi:hypothetical protein Rs2_09799 [Raphanus sativus]|nr:hypothetical protein Rs2_09799 [Raphanus sativus]